MAFLVPQTGNWEYAFRDPQTLLVCYWLDQHGNVGLQSIQFADGTVQSTAASSGGSAIDSVQSFAADGTIVMAAKASTLVRATSGAGGITLTLPDATTVTGQRARIKKVDTGVGAVSIVTVSAQTIDGALYGTSYSLTNFMQFVTLESDGSNWLIVGGN